MLIFKYAGCNLGLLGGTCCRQHTANCTVKLVLEGGAELATTFGKVNVQCHPSCLLTLSTKKATRLPAARLAAAASGWPVGRWPPPAASGLSSTAVRRLVAADPPDCALAAGRPRAAGKPLGFGRPSLSSVGMAEPPRPQGRRRPFFILFPGPLVQSN